MPLFKLYWPMHQLDFSEQECNSVDILLLLANWKLQYMHVFLSARTTACTTRTIRVISLGFKSVFTVEPVSFIGLK